MTTQTPSREEVQTAYENARRAGDYRAMRMLAKFLDELPPAGPPPKSGSFADAAGQGLFFGFSDELAGGLGAGVNSIANLFDAGTGDSFGEAYRSIRDAARENLDAYRYHNPNKALAAEVGGGLLTGGAGAARVGVLTGGQGLARQLPRYAGLGAVEGGAYGAGASRADTVAGTARDAGKGALLGGALAPVAPLAARTLSGTIRGANQVANVLSDFGGLNAALAATAVKLGIPIPVLRRLVAQLPAASSSAHRIDRAGELMGVFTPPTAAASAHIGGLFDE